MRNEKVTFPGSAGTPLAGRLDLPDARPRAFASGGTSPAHDTRFGSSKTADVAPSV